GDRFALTGPRSRYATSGWVWIGMIMTYATEMRRGVTADAPVCLGMWSPRRRGQEPDLLGLDQGPELGGKTFDKIFIRKERRPVRSSVGIVVELPQVHQLMQRARVGEEVAHQLLVEPALLEGGVAKLGSQEQRPENVR